MENNGAINDKICCALGYRNLLQYVDGTFDVKYERNSERPVKTSDGVDQKRR